MNRDLSPSVQLLGVAQVNQHGPVYVDHPRERHVLPVSVGINADGNIAVASLSSFPRPFASP